VLDAHAERLRALVTDKHEPIGSGALVAALTIAGASRRVSRRALLGLGWLRRPTGGDRKVHNLQPARTAQPVRVRACSK